MNSRPSSSTLHIQSRLWPILAGLLLLLQLVWPSRAWTTLLLILGGAWLVGYLWARSLSRGLNLVREIRYTWAHVGDRLEQRFIAINNGWAPGLWLEVEDHSNLPDFTASRVTMIDGHATNQWKIEGTCTRRGLYTLGPTSIRSGDPLGIYMFERYYSDSTVLMVLPPVLPLPAIEIAPGGKIGEGHRPRRSALEATVSVDSVREYVPGDPLKSIHWRTTARRGTPYVRQFEHTPSSDWWIFLDLEARIQVGQGFDSTEEHGIILAASLADRGLRQGHAVGLVAHGKELVWIPPQRHSGQLMDILRALAVVTTGERPVADLLTSAHKSMQRGANLVLITPDTSASWFGPLLGLLKSDVAPTVLLLDPVSFGGKETPDQAGNLLDTYGIARTVIQRGLLDHTPNEQELQGRWEWRVVGYGKAVAVRKPKDMTWRHIG